MRAIAPLLAAVFLFLKAPVLVSTAIAQATPVAETPPESCLAAFTFPVFPGEHPHDVAPAADGRHIWYTAQHAGALGLLDPVSGRSRRFLWARALHRTGSWWLRTARRG